MADLKARVNVVAVCQEGGPVAGTLSDSIAVHSLGFDATVSVSGNGKAASQTVTLGAGGSHTVDLSAMGIGGVALLMITNTSSDKQVAVAWASATADLLPHGLLAIASKAAQYDAAGSAALLTITGPSGATVELVVAGDAADAD